MKLTWLWVCEVLQRIPCVFLKTILHKKGERYKINIVGNISELSWSERITTNPVMKAGLALLQNESK